MGFLAFAISIIVVLFYVGMRQNLTGDSQGDSVEEIALPNDIVRSSSIAAKPKLGSVELQPLEVDDSQEPTSISAETWAKANGYDAIRQFVEIEDQDVEAIYSDYLSYDLDTLLALANQGDGLAQLYYAKNIENTDREQALHWYEKAAVSTGYTAIVEKIIFAHYDNASQIALELDKTAGWDHAFE